MAGVRAGCAGRAPAGRGGVLCGAVSAAGLRKAGRFRRGSGRRSAAATLDARRALLADRLSCGARRRPPFARGAPAGRLGWRLAADLELVRTRGIRLFN